MKYLGCLGLLLLAGCDGLPLRFPNDTRETVRMDAHGRDFPTPMELEAIPPGETFGTRQCWAKSDAFFLATKDQPDPAVFDPKEFCEPGDCDCEISVSKIVRRMTPDDIVKRQQDVCAGRGPFLQPEIRAQLCTLYVARSAGDKSAPLLSRNLDAMLDR